MEQIIKGILVVSFGTTHEDTRKLTIEAIEKRIREDYPDRKFYRAWTSDVIRRILKKRDQYEVDSVEEALNRCMSEGISDLIVQPTHVINGYETDYLMKLLDNRKHDFESLKVGTPLLTSQEDNEKTVDILTRRWEHLPKDEAIVLMGHGTEHHANNVYAALNYLFAEKGMNQMFLGTVEGYPTVENVKSAVSKSGVKKVHLAPFMIVAGDHAKNDMAGDEEDSWKNQFLEMGLEVECHFEALGENKDIQNMFAEHVRKAK